MRIKIFARSFFEARKGSPEERAILRRCRVISINTVSTKERPPFSKELFCVRNLLILYFDDTEGGFPNSMKDSDADAIISFVRKPGPQIILIHCTAGISRSGAVGKVLNWYFNRYLQRNNSAFERFTIENPDIEPNHFVHRKLLVKLLSMEKRCRQS